MAITPLSLAGPSMLPSQEAAARTASTQGGSFGNIVGPFLQGAANSHQQAETAINDLALGRTDNLHGVLMQVPQADLAFRLILEIRNRLADAYQEVMKMQV